jgi:hypothetical protein
MANGSKPNDAEPVASGIFDFLDAYLTALEKKEIDSTSPIKSPAPIGDFLFTFYQQFFDSGWKVEITAIDLTSKGQAAKLRLAKAPKPERSAVKLISAFEDLCDLWQDLLGFQYGGHASELLRFHETYLPRLLKRIVDWARALNHPLLLGRAEVALARLMKGTP